MKIEGSIQEIKEFMKEFKSNDTAFTKQQLNQIKQQVENIKIDGVKISEAVTPSLKKIDTNLQDS